MAALKYARTFLLLLSVVGSAWSAVTDFGMTLSFNKASLKVGEVVTVSMSATFPSGNSANTIMEVIATTDDPPVFAVRKVKDDTANKGTDITAIDSNWASGATLHLGIGQSATNAIRYNTRAVLPAGSVTSTGISSGSSTVSVDYELVLVSMGTYTSGQPYCTASGTEYNSQTRIYVVQDCLNIYEADNTGVDAPTFTMDDSFDIDIMTPLTMPLTMRMTYPEAEVTVTVSLLVGDITDVHVVKMVTRSVGEAYTYSVDATKIKEEFYTCPPKNEMTLYFGKLINSVSWSTIDAQSDIIVDITLMTANREIVGKQLSVAVGATINSQEIYVKIVNLTVTNSGASPSTPTSAIVQAPTVPNISPGYAGTILLDIETPPQSNNDYEIRVRTAANSATANALSFLSVNPSAYGSNLPCAIHPTNINVELTSSAGNGLNDQARITFNVSNYGYFTTGTDENRLTLELAVMMMPTAVEADTHDLFVEVVGAPEGEQTRTFTVDAAQPYDSPVAYVMDVNNKCAQYGTDDYESGSTVTIEVEVKTERDKTPGPMEIEWSIPPNLTQSAFVPLELIVVEKGANVPCVQLGKVTFNTSKWDTSSTGEDDRAVAVIPLVCNMESVNDVNEDKFKLALTARIKDTPEVLTASTKTAIPFGLGIMYSTTQIFVATVTINALPPLDLFVPSETHVKLVTGLTLDTQCMPGVFPADIVLQYSPDNVNYYDVDPARNAWDTKTLDGNLWTVNLKPPLVARWVRVVNKLGTCMCGQAIVNEVDGQPEMYGPLALSGPLLQWLPVAMDNNLDTCITMPQRDASATTPYFWMETKAVNLGLTGANKFTVTMTGQNIQCHDRYGPQVTYLAFPKETAASFRGTRVLCTATGNSTVQTTLTQCNYECACAGADQCEKFALLMLHTVPGNEYKLCEISFAEV